MKDKVSFAKKKIEQLQQKIKSFKTSREFLEFVRAMSRFHTYSFRNQMLILSQKPKATRVAGFRTWRKMGRYVKRGEKGIMILVPIAGVKENEDGEAEEFHWFKSAHVFDISQTNGESLPEISLDVTDNGEGFYHACFALATRHGIAVNIVENLTAYGASRGGEVLLRADVNKTAMAATLVHEIAHEWLHQNSEESLDKECKELEAETVAYMVCVHFGIDVPSHKYLATWQKNHQIMDSLKRISQCSHQMIEELEILQGKMTGYSNVSAL